MITGSVFVPEFDSLSRYLPLAVQAMRPLQTNNRYP